MNQVQVGDAGSYWVTVSNSWGAVTSPPANLHVRVLEQADWWSYDLGGQDLGSFWREPAFDDSPWASGCTVFQTGGGPLPWPAGTELLPSATTRYLRHTFAVPDGPSPSRLQFHWVVDDGAVVYFNGREVLRVGMAQGVVGFNMPATRDVGSAIEEGPQTAEIDNAIVGGENVVAVELHQSADGAADAAFGLTMEVVESRVLPPVIVEQPDDVRGTVGGTVHLHVVAHGSSPLHYQWYRLETGPLPGASGSSLTLSNLTIGDAGYYWVVVDNPAGSQSSALVYMGVADAPLGCEHPRILDDALAFDYRAAPGWTYTIESSSDLVTWRAEATHAGQSGDIHVTFPLEAGADQRFFRLRVTRAATN
jgi:hypothetical protein